jgi:hypothetical protein
VRPNNPSLAPFPLPHNAGASTGTYGRGVEIFLLNLENYLAARPLEN